MSSVDHLDLMGVTTTNAWGGQWMGNNMNRGSDKWSDGSGYGNPLSSFVESTGKSQSENDMNIGHGEVKVLLEEAAKFGGRQPKSWTRRTTVKNRFMILSERRCNDDSCHDCEFPTLSSSCDNTSSIGAHNDDEVFNGIVHGEKS